MSEKVVVLREKKIEREREGREMEGRMRGEKERVLVCLSFDQLFVCECVCVEM